MSQRIKVPVGLLYSTTGPYAAMGQDGLDGALLALEEANTDDRFEFVPVIANPMGDLDRYPSLAKRLLAERGCKQLLGTITSSARKEVIPTIEKYDGLLWYTCPHEGFETNDNVIYVGSCPNQHLVPLFTYLLPRYGRRVFLLGSNYIWGWEINRIARALVQAAKGEIVSERYLGLDESVPSRLLSELRAKQPDIVLNNLVGTTSHAFLAAFDGLRREVPELARCRVVSCDLTECELQKVGAPAAGTLAALSHLASLDTEANHGLAARLTRRFGEQRVPSAYVTGAYMAGCAMVGAVRQGGSDALEAVKSALYAGPQETPLGPLRISPRSNHAALPCYIGEATGDGTYRLIAGDDRPIEGDPYLVDFDMGTFAAAVQTGPSIAKLRIVQ